MSDQPDATVNEIWRLHAAIDTIYGKGYAKDNPSVVAMFMQALATRHLAVELGNLREIVASGSGGFTVGIEK